MDASAKQQVVERVKQAQNILVTVSTNPSVDQLAACIGLTLLLNKMGKHATAVFSGKVPSTIEFLQPDKTIERNTDSLRDFIISLDKEKADKLRYKVEDQVVKIFITPYKTSLSQNDLVFSQGDYNVEVVMALGVKDKTHLDAAITSHGRILHDATVISVNAGADKAQEIGQINWLETASSSLSEMLVSISEAFGPNLIDGQMATAFLTGIVAETQRFSNPKTSPKVMTMSAQLMAAGANQQLIASKLEPPKVPAQQEPAGKPAAPPAPSAGPPDGTLSVNHNKAATAGPQEVNIDSSEIHIDSDGNIIHNEEDSVAQGVISTPATQTEPEKVAQQTTPEQAAAPAAELPIPQPESTAEESAPPTPEIPLPEGLDQVSAAPSAPPAEPPSTKPHALLDPKVGPIMETAFTANTEPGWNQNGSTMAPDPFTDAGPTASQGFLTHGPSVETPGVSAPRVISSSDNSSPLPTPPADNPVLPPVDQARSAVDSAYAAAPFTPELNPVASLNAVPLGELHPQEAAAPSTNQSDMAPPAPPPLPPPLMPSPGVVIPSQPYNPPANVSQNGS